MGARDADSYGRSQKTVFQTNQWRQNGELQRYFLRALRFISCSESKLLNYVSLKAFGMSY
jgi:hypothetical protein